jgi:hypothetical protein
MAPGQSVDSAASREVLQCAHFSDVCSTVVASVGAADSLAITSMQPKHQGDDFPRTRDIIPDPSQRVLHAGRERERERKRAARAVGDLAACALLLPPPLARGQFGQAGASATGCLDSVAAYHSHESNKHLSGRGHPHPQAVVMPALPPNRLASLSERAQNQLFNALYLPC